MKLKFPSGGEGGEVVVMFNQSFTVFDEIFETDTIKEQTPDSHSCIHSFPHLVWRSI